ncbi:MAG: cellulase family glycosylhydrolase [Sphingobacteriales bacterium]|nr:cellulase family glycosylhydrolase [Sphingobacteriales bacterium]
MLRKIIACFLIIVCFAPITHAQFFSTKGKNIIGPDGKPFLIKGTNLGNWLVPEGYMFHFKDVSSPRLINQTISELIGPAAAKDFWKKYLDVYITAEDIHYLKSIGMNSIRIPFNYRLFTNEYYMGSGDSARGFVYMDRVISWCKKEKLYVILDMHCSPGGQTGDNIDDGYGYPFLFENEKDQAECTAIWKRIANHYKNEAIIIGYDLLNEPIAHYFDKAKLNPLLEPLYKRLTAAVRSVDKNHLLFLGGAQWDSNFEPFSKPFDSKLVYTFHKYWTPTTVDVIQDYISFSNKYNVPIYCGETGENDDAWVEAFRKTLDSNQIGWHYWPYKKLDNTRGIVTFSIPAGYDSVIAYAGIYKNNFDDIRKHRPADVALIKKALNGFLENCRFKNCIENKGYIKALGFKPGE